MQANITFIGAGNMAKAIIGGLLATGYPAKNILASDPFASDLDAMKAQQNIRISRDNKAAIADAQIVVLAVKPQLMAEVLQPLRQDFTTHHPVVLSIAAGINLNSLGALLGEHLPIVRCMPNTPALIQQAASALVANACVNAQQRALCTNLMSSIGICCWLENEADIDAVTALSGSGPAYIFKLIETLTLCGETLGLDPQLSAKLALQTTLGAAQMAAASDVDAAELRKRVTSPGGTTQAALHVLQQEGMDALFIKALSAARDRSLSLSDELTIIIEEKLAHD